MGNPGEWPSSSPDRLRIAFVSNRSGAYHLYVMNADGTNIHRVPTGQPREDAPSWQRQG